MRRMTVLARSVGSLRRSPTSGVRGEADMPTCSTDANDPGCVKTLGGITAPGILGPTVMRRAKNAKICLPLGITTKSDFVVKEQDPFRKSGQC